jgi:hypothetical protein
MCTLHKGRSEQRPYRLNFLSGLTLASAGPVEPFKNVTVGVFVETFEM